MKSFFSILVFLTFLATVSHGADLSSGAGIETNVIAIAKAAVPGLFYDKALDEYDCSDIQWGPLAAPWQQAIINIDRTPETFPENPSPTASGARYAVATFHTHPPMTYASSGLRRMAGPSGIDETNAVERGFPSVVLDYVPEEGDDGMLLSGHSLNADHQLFLIPSPTRRTSP